MRKCKAPYSRVVSWAGLFGSGRFGPDFGPSSGLSSSKCFGPISVPHTQVCYTTGSNEFVLSWRTFLLLTAVTSVSEGDFSWANSICKHSCVPLFSARISVTHFNRRQLPAVRKLAPSGIASKRSSITYVILRLCWETMAYNPSFHVYNAVLVPFMPIAPLWIVSWLFVFMLRNITFRSISID